MLEFFTSKGFAVTWGPGLVILTHKDRPDVTLDYPTLRAAFIGQRGPLGNLHYTGGRK